MNMHLVDAPIRHTLPFFHHNSTVLKGRPDSTGVCTIQYVIRKFEDPSNDETYYTWDAFLWSASRPQDMNGTMLFLECAADEFGTEYEAAVDADKHLGAMLETQLYVPVEQPNARETFAQQAAREWLDWEKRIPDLQTGETFELRICEVA